MRPPRSLATTATTAITTINQLPLLALTLVLISGGLIQHFFSGVPLPYTVLLLLFGMALGCWVTFDPNFTLQPGMVAHEHAWVATPPAVGSGGSPPSTAAAPSARTTSPSGGSPVAPPPVYNL